MRSLLLGIDLGTGGCKVSIVDGEGRLVSSGSSEYETFHQRADWSEQDPAHWYSAFKEALAQSVSCGGITADEICAIGMDGATHSAVLLDADMNVLRNVIIWTDQRSTKESAWLDLEHGDGIFETTFNRPSPTWTLPQLLWIRDNEPDVFASMRHIMFAKDYLRHLLAGGWETDIIDAQGSMLLDARSHEWSESLCKIATIDPSTLPPLRSPTDVCGYVTARAASDTGLREGVPVVVGASDTTAESFAAGAIHAGDCVVKLATAGTVNVLTNSPHPDRKSLTYSYVVDGLWYTCLATVSAAASLRWYRDVFGYEEQSIARESGVSPFEVIDEAVEQIRPGSDGLLFHPYLMGERSPYWDSNLCASFTGIRAYHCKAHFSRAVMEGVCFSLLDCAEAAESMGLTFDEVRCIGGGAKSGIWRTILAQVLNKPIVKLSADDSSVGAAMMAGIGTGVFDGVVDATERCVHVESRVEPDSETVEVYRKCHRIYRDIHDAVAGVYPDLAEMRP